MKRPLAGAFAGALLAAAALTGLAATPASALAPHHHRGTHAAAPDFAGTVALSNCSGSLVRMPDSKPGDPGLVLTNGHCLETGMPGPGEVVTDQPSSRSFTLLDARAGDAGTLHAAKVEYATMTGTDVTLYQLDQSYDEIQDAYGIAPLEVDASHPVQGHAITVVSGYWKQTYSCSVDGFVPTLREADWTFTDSIRYTSDCQTIGGTSGSPIVDDASGKVVGVNNTRNESGERCTLDNPCEVDENGGVTVHEGIAYGQETNLLTACVGDGNEVDLSLPDCELPRP